MKDVFINIKGTQGLGDDSDVIEFSTEGKLDKKSGEYFLYYREGETFGEKSVKTKVSVLKDGSVTIERTGSISSKLLVKDGVRNSCFYSSPQGELVIGIFGEKVENDLENGRLYMSYAIDSNLVTVSRNTVEITLKEVKKCQ